MESVQLSRGKRFLASLVGLLIVVVIVVVVGELMVRFLRPQPSMYPRWQYSQKYGAMLFPNRQMVHQQPGDWCFVYTTNLNQCRGELIPISNRYERTNIIVHGDSYGFGTGVADDEVFAAVLSRELGDGYDTVNCSVGGWGLTQHIRRFYEFGQLYDPRAVVVQFCNNDPRDNFKNRVTAVEDGKFVFRNSAFGLNFIKRFLSDSRVQKSQLYNLVRNPLYMLFARPTLTDAMKNEGEEGPDAVPVEERFHNELLEAFAEDLDARGIALIVIAVDGQMREFPHIDAKVAELEERGLLRYCEVEEWFEGKEHPKSPEGHVWGKEAHAIIGTELAGVIRELPPVDTEQ